MRDCHEFATTTKGLHAFLKYTGLAFEGKAMLREDGSLPCPLFTASISLVEAYDNQPVACRECERELYDALTKPRSMGMVN